MSRISDSRRRFLRLLAAAAALPLVRWLPAFAATSLPHLLPSDPAAKNLAYTEDASKLSKSKEPAYKPGSVCATCANYQTAQASGGYAPCAIFPGKSVKATGWCRAFAPKA